jgi:hypothetical protein
MSNRLDQHIDDALLTASTSLAFIYARRRARRAAPKVLIGTGVVAAAGTVAVGAMIGVGLLGAGGAAVAWYRHRSKTSESMNGWQAPATAPRSSFVDKDPNATAPAASLG